jgi:hypothetical protein
MGLVTTIAVASPQMVKTSCNLLKVSLNTSNVPDGATRVKNRSSPYAKMSELDSKNAGEVSMRRTFATCDEEKRNFAWIVCSDGG